MIYQFRCPMHGVFEINQPMHQHHEAICPVCNGPTQRVYTSATHYWAGQAHNPDGSVQELPPAPQDNNYGWHGFGYGKKKEEIAGN